jgi:hypothetical protein
MLDEAAAKIEDSAHDQQETRMLQELPRFVVERRVPKMTSSDLAGLHAALADAAQRLSAESDHVACMRTIYLPSQERWIAVFEAETPDTVHRAAKIAQLPPGDVHEAIEMTASRQR